MGFGVLEDRLMPRPPGTSLLSDVVKKRKSMMTPPADTTGLKKSGNIVLIPQPADDPNDPLNWSIYMKWTISVIIGGVSVAVHSMGGMLHPALVLISEEYKVSLDQVNAWTIAQTTVWTSVFAFFTAAGANIIGKRPFLLGALVLLLISNVWGAMASSFVSLACVRALQGIATAPFETMTNAMVTDVFFLHQRGSLLSIFGIIISTGALISQIISGLVIENLGYKMTFGVSAGVFVGLVILGYLLLPETTYFRKTIDPNGLNSTKAQEPGVTRPEPAMSHGAFEFEDEKGQDYSQYIEDKMHASSSPMPERVPKKESFAQSLSIYRGRLPGSTAKFWVEVIKPFPLILSPPIFYGAVINGIAGALFSGIGLLSTIILATPPYSLTPSQLGFIHIPTFIVTLVVSPLSGWVADWSAKFVARRNGGIFEPEFRLLPMLIGIPLSVASLIGYGEAIARVQPLPVVLFWMSLQAAATPFKIQAGLSYLLDIHAKDANQAFVANGFFRALFAAIAQSLFTGWYETLGIRKLVLIVAMANFGISLTTIPLYIYGKRMRAAFARSKLGKTIFPEHYADFHANRQGGQA